MNKTTKKQKTESEEFARFEELTRKLVSVPKEDVAKEEKKFKKEQAKKGRAR